MTSTSMRDEIQANARPKSRYSILLLLVLVAGFFVVLRPSIHGNDGVQNYAYLRSLLIDGDLDFTNEYNYYLEKNARWFNHQELAKDPVTGLPVNLYGVGNAILWSPWVATVHFGPSLIIGLLLGPGEEDGPAIESGEETLPDGYGPLYTWAVSAASCFYGSLGLWLIYRLLRRFGASDAAAFWSVALVLLASPLFFYLYLHPSMSHANSLFLVSVILTLYFGKRTMLRWAGLGAAAGLLVITRFQDAVLLLPLAGAEAVSFFRAEAPSPGRRLALYLAGAITFAICLIPQLVAWHVLQGSALSGPRGYLSHGSIRPWAPLFAANALFSPRHGLFYWHPALLLAALGLLLPGPWQRERLLALAALTLQAWIIGSWSIWWAGASFGHRMFISTLPFLAIGAAYLQIWLEQRQNPVAWTFLSAQTDPGATAPSGLNQQPSARQRLAAPLVRVVVLLLALWNFGCIVQYGLGWIDRQGPVSYATLAYNNFVRIPALLLK